MTQFYSITESGFVTGIEAPSLEEAWSSFEHHNNLEETAIVVDEKTAKRIIKSIEIFEANK